MRGLLITTAAILFTAAALAKDLPNGQYEGTTDGGDLALTVANGRATVSVGVQGCVGEADGALTSRGQGQWTLSLKDGVNICEIDVQAQGKDRLNLAEAKCGYFHGVRCSFDGYVYRP